MKNFTLAPANKREPEPDLCRCSECDKEHKVDNCIHDYDHHDGWEMPAYTEIICPDCESGGEISDFYFSEDIDQ